MRGPLGPSGHATTALQPLARDDRNTSGLDLVPVVVVYVGSIEAFDHLGGAGARGLEDAEGDEGPAVCIVQAVRINDEGDVREGLGEAEEVYAEFPDVVPTSDVQGGAGRLARGAGVDIRKLEGDVADTGTPVGDAELAGARGDGLVILAAHVRDARANLRLRSLAAPPLRRPCLACFLLHLRRLTRAQLRHLCRVHVLALSFILALGSRAGYGRDSGERKGLFPPSAGEGALNPDLWVRGRESPRWSWNP